MDINNISNPPTADSTFHKAEFDLTEPITSPRPKSTMYVWIFSTWVVSLIWFEPRLFQLLDIANSGLEYFSLVIFIFFIDFAWLYGIYNIFIIIFAVYYKLQNKNTLPETTQHPTDYPPVSILYTTCNDFVKESALSCLNQDYPDFKLYILDDSTDESYKNMIDQFALLDEERIRVIRRPNRKGFKAGNLNHALKHAANQEKYFAIADADEILPTDFLRQLVPIMEADPMCGFVQANHESNPSAQNRIQKDMSIGINAHWKWYQPLRNRYGFVMFLGHGALLRYECWKKIKGFPEIVSEDLGFAIAIREKGYRGKFEEKVICYEDFPDSVRSFRIRHMKWTRGTCEFLYKKAGWLLRAKNISWVEKADILFPTLNLPLTLVFFLFMINANLLMPALFGHFSDLTLVIAGKEIIIPVVLFDQSFSTIYSPDFFFITILTFFAPVLCFMLAMRKTPAKLFVFLSHSTALYASLSILSSIGIIAFMISRKAEFLVTGDKNFSLQSSAKRKSFLGAFKERYNHFITKSHPDSHLVQSLEIIFGFIFLIAGLLMMQVSFFGLCFAFLLLPFLHYYGWDHKAIRLLLYLPFFLIIAGVIIGGLSIFGMQSVFFGYGFHF